MHQSNNKDFLYAALKKYLMGRSSAYLNPGSRRTMSKIMGCPMLKWDMLHPDTQLGKILQSITALNESWIRSLDAFDPEEVAYASRLDEELFRFLFLRYEIPEFLDNQLRTILTNGYEKPLEKHCLAWIVILGQGGSLQKAGRVLGWNMPSRFSQSLFEVPATGINLEHGVAWALTLAVGGKAPDCLKQIQLISSNGLRFLLEPGRDHFKPFWLQTTRWMIRNRVELDDDRWNVIRRWLPHINTEVLLGHAHFSWKGRSVKSVHSIAQDYLSERKLIAEIGPWQRKGWDWRKLVDGIGECAIVELASPEELVEEGEFMDHCVGMYADSCRDGGSAIFSLRIDGIRALTLELSTEEQKIKQAYGFRNREPSDQELVVVEKWQSLLSRDEC